MSKHIEGTVVLKMHGFVNADNAAAYLSHAFNALDQVWAVEEENDERPHAEIEVLQMNLYQVVKEDHADE